MNTLCATACLSVIQGEGCILSAFKVSIKVLMEVSCIDAKDWGFNEICDGSEDDRFPRRRDRLSLFALKLTITFCRFVLTICLHIWKTHHFSDGLIKCVFLSSF